MTKGKHARRHAQAEWHVGSLEGWTWCVSPQVRGVLESRASVQWGQTGGKSRAPGLGPRMSGSCSWSGAGSLKSSPSLFLVAIRAAEGKLFPAHLSPQL
jgi:hypothetical protein